MTTILDLKDIHVYYDKAVALAGISLRVETGKIVTLLGANGAGKTTTLRMISGLKRASSGEILFKGEVINEKLPSYIVRKGIAHVPEGRRLFPFMSVHNNLLMGAYLRKDSKEINRNLELVYSHFPKLKERSSQRADSLSGGEQQMVAIGRGLMASPSLLLFDEPTMGLSPILVKETATIIKDINRESSVTILLIEQNAKMALSIADYAYILEAGRLVKEGDAQDMINDEDIKKAYLGG
jgi:branched-chain amino acid transport system ATP-binding protein